MEYFLPTLILFFLIVGTAAADVGIGLKWSTESEFVSEGQEKCVSYGIYNPFDTDVNGYLRGTKDLSTIYRAEEPKLISGTSSSEAIPTEICFTVPPTYEEESILGFLPQKKCPEKNAEIRGEVVAAYTLGAGVGTGSATGASFAAPLRLRVRCTPIERSWTPVYIIAGVFLVVLAFLGFRRRRSV